VNFIGFAYLGIDGRNSKHKGPQRVTLNGKSTKKQFRLREYFWLRCTALVMASGKRMLQLTFDPPPDLHHI
jgi:hypothetical protein